MVDSGSPLSTGNRESATSPPNSAISSRSKDARSRGCTPPSALVTGPLISTMRATLLGQAHFWATAGTPRAGCRHRARGRLDPAEHRGYVFHITDGTFRFTEERPSAGSPEPMPDGTDSQGES